MRHSVWLVTCLVIVLWLYETVCGQCNSAGHYILLLMFFFQHGIFKVPRLVATQLCHMIGMGEIFKTKSHNLGCFLQKIGGKKSPSLARFWTTSEFDHEYLQNWTRYRQSENGIASYTVVSATYDAIIWWTSVHKWQVIGWEFGHTLQWAFKFCKLLY